MKRFLYEWIKYTLLFSAIIVFLLFCFRMMPGSSLRCGRSEYSQFDFFYDDFYYQARQVLLLVLVYFSLPSIILLGSDPRNVWASPWFGTSDFPLPFFYEVFFFCPGAFMLLLAVITFDSLIWGGIVVGINYIADALNRYKQRLKFT